MSNRDLALSLVEGGWVGGVKTVSTYPPPGTFTLPAEKMANIMASKSVSPKGLGSAIKMLNMHKNRAGKLAKKYPATWGRQIKNVEKAISILQRRNSGKT